MQVMEGHAGHVWHLLGFILALESIGPNGVELPGPATVTERVGERGGRRPREDDVDTRGLDMYLCMSCRPGIPGSLHTFLPEAKLTCLYIYHIAPYVGGRSLLASFRFLLCLLLPNPDIHLVSTVLYPMPRPSPPPSRLASNKGS